MADVFISYKREDRELVRPLARALQERGFTVWWDSRIEAGQNWMACIKRALDTSKCIIVLWTPQSVGPDDIYISEIVGAEADVGRNHNILLPVRMQNGPFAFPHNLRNAEDLTGWQGNSDDSSFERLAARVLEYCGERTRPDSAELVAWLDAEKFNNAQAYRNFRISFPQSRFATEAEPRAAEIELRAADVEIARETAVSIIARFEEEMGKPECAPPLAFGKVVQGVSTALSTDVLFDHLASGARAVLQAEPGAGKTIKLLDWARGYGASGESRVGVFLRLKEVANTADDLIAHVGRLESNGHVSGDAWKALARSGVLSLFCDGWNELSDQERETIGTKLNIFARSYPSSGLVVGSRPLAPTPFSGEHLLLFLQRFSTAQVLEVLESQLKLRAQPALAELRQSGPLTDLVHIPFFLMAFCRTRLAGVTPSTREGLIRGMIEVGERLPQHSAPLRRVLKDQQSKYLMALAVYMLSRQSVDLTNDEARQVANQKSSTLVASHILTSLPEASEVLNTLRDHHCLIEYTGVEPSFRFQHQLIEEWYASGEVRRLAQQALSDGEARSRLDRDILDHPRWAEAIRFAVEKPSDSPTDIASTSYLILRMIGIDPDFAADLIAAAPKTVWEQILPIVRSFTNEWRDTAKHGVFRFAMRSGKEEFSDIIWDAIASEGSGNVGLALRGHRFEHPSVLGPNWLQRLEQLSVEDRASLLAMLASNSGLQGAEMAASAAAASTEPKVQERVAEMLDFYGFYDELSQVLQSATARTWEVMVLRQNIDVIWEEPWRSSALAAAHRLFAQLPSGPSRLNFGLRMKSMGEEVHLDFVSELMAIKFDSPHDENALYTHIAEIAGDQLSASLIDRACEGHQVTYLASRYIKKDMPVDQERILAACRALSQHGRHDVLSPILSVTSLRIVLSELLEARTELNTVAGKERQVVVDRWRSLQDILTSAGKNKLAEMIIGLSPSDPMDISEIGEIIMRAYRRDSSRDDREPLRADLHARLVQRLEEWTEVLLASTAFDRYAFHHLAEAISTFPSPSLLAPLRRLLSADLNQWRAEKEEFARTIARGESPNPGSGARMSYAYRYGQNMLSLATGRNADEHDDRETNDVTSSIQMTDAVVELLSDFFLDQEFGEEAARVVANLRPDPIFAVGRPRQFVSFDLRVVPDRRKARAALASQPIDSVTIRLLDAIDQCAIGQSSESYRLAVTLAIHAVRMNCGVRLASVSSLVFSHGTPEAVMKLMMHLLLLGHEVDGGTAERCLDVLDGRQSERTWEYNENWSMWEKFLVLMIFGGNPIEAANRLLTYDRPTRQHDERPIIEALGLCGHPSSLAALGLLRQRCMDQRIMDAWCASVQAIATADAGAILLTTLLELKDKDGWRADENFFAMVARLSEDHPSVRGGLLEVAARGDASSLNRVAGVIRHWSREEFLVEVLSIPGDRLQVLESAIANAMRNLCIEHRPIEGSNDLRDVVPRPLNDLRAKLFVRANEDRVGSVACVRLLQIVEEYRDDYGRPIEERRHPDITVGRPWPAAAYSAWTASAELLQSAAAPG